MHSIRFSLRCAGVAAAALMFSSGAALATSVSTNTGSLGATANGTNSDTATFATGVVTGNSSDKSVVYNNTDASRTTVPLLGALNPASTSPFTIEFWAKPASTDNDSAPVSNRVSSGNRSGWAFFERDASTGWNFRMYNGSGSGLSTDITGGTATIGAWSQVVATWNGSTAQLYVNGLPISASNTGTGTYNPNTTVPLTVGALADAGDSSPFDGAIDEVAFYGSALSSTQVAAHFAAVSNATPGTYYSLIQSDGALLQLSNVPEPTTLGLFGAGMGLIAFRRRRTA